MQARKGADKAIADARECAARDRDARDVAEAAQQAVLAAEREGAERLRAAEFQATLDKEQRHEVLTVLAERESKLAEVGGPDLLPFDSCPPPIPVLPRLSGELLHC